MKKGGQSSNHRTTLADVAAHAGVSRATASRALADDKRITAATRAAVRDAAEALEYVPNLTARNLRARHTRALGLLLADLSDPVHGQVAAGFELEAAEAGYTVIIVAARGDLFEERRALTTFVERGTDGICAASIAMDPAEVRTRVGGTPLSLIQPEHDSLIAEPFELPDGAIHTDDESGVRQAVQHLVESGRRNIGYLGSGERTTNRLRRTGCRRALHDIADRDLREFQVGDDAWTTPIEVADALGRDPPEAVVCYDDKIALALMDGLRTRGVLVPDDVAVVGFDGIPFAALSNPRLTTVVTPAVEMGQLAAGSLVRAIALGQPSPARVLRVELVVRESSVKYPEAPLGDVGRVAGDRSVPNR